MLLEQHFLQLFGNLPYLPKAEITKHLKEFDLIKASLVSGNWDKAIESREKNDVARNPITPESQSLFGGTFFFTLKKIPQFHMTSKTDRVEMRINEPGPLGAELVIDFPVESVLENSTEIDEYGDRVICHSENFEQFENRILATFHKIRTWVDVETSKIEVNLDFGFDLEFLKKLRLENFDSFELSGDKKNCQIDGKELSDLMKTWDLRSVRIKTETIGRFEGNPDMLWGDHCEFTDSRWFTGDMLMNISRSRTFKRCLLTSEDFNRFFKEWKSTERFVERLECQMENELDVEKVLEGLEAKKWNPKRRGRLFRIHGYTFINLADGMDIYRSYGKIGTILISADKKVIKFFSWSDKFPLKTAKKDIIRMIDQLKPQLDQFVRSPREFARIAKRVEHYEAQLQTANEVIAREKQYIELHIN